MSSQKHHEKQDRAQDHAVENSFPASDPAANTGITGAEPPARGPGEVDPQPTGTPTSDRHAAETAHHKEHEKTSSN